MRLCNYRLLICLLLFGCTACVAVRSDAQPILRVTVRRGAEYAAVVVGGRVWIRLRGPDCAKAASEVARRLSQVLVDGIKPQDITVRKQRGEAVIRARGRTVVTVTRSQATAQRSSVSGLVRRWAEALKSIVGRPYIAVATDGEVWVPVGERRPIRIGGTARADVSVVCSDPDILAVEASGNCEPYLTGLAPGDTRIELRTADARLPVVVHVRYWAAYVPGSVAAVATARPKAEEWRRYAQYVAATSVRARRGSAVSVKWLSLAWPSALAEVDAKGQDVLAVTRKLRISANTRPGEFPWPSHVLVSNNPERVARAHVLARGLVGERETVRLLWHHLNVGRMPLWIGTRLWNVSSGPAYVYWNDAVAGPETDELHVGHVACKSYLDQVQRGTYILLTLGGRQRVGFAYRKAKPGHVISGLATLGLVGGGPVMVEFVAESQPPAPVSVPLSRLPENLSPPRPVRFEGEIRKEAVYRVGGPWTFISVGKKPQTNEHGGLLHGNYGVLYRIKLTLENPTARGREVELLVRSGGGAVRGNLLIDRRIVEVPLLRAGASRRAARWRLPAGGRKTIEVLTIPQAGSNYPINLIVRSRVR